MDPVDSPAVDPEVSENLFASYSYVAPSILFTENNVISEDMFRPDPDKKPSKSNLVGCILQVRTVLHVEPRMTVILKFALCVFNFPPFLSCQKSPFFLHYDLDVRERILGDGSYSVCRRCVHRQTGQERAVKIVSRRIDCSR